MDALLLAIRSILGWAWDIFSINIPVLNVPFWIIAMAAVAVDLAFYILGRLIGSSVASPPTLPKGKPANKKSSPKQDLT